MLPVLPGNEGGGPCGPPTPGRYTCYFWKESVLWKVKAGHHLVGMATLGEGLLTRTLWGAAQGLIASHEVINAEGNALCPALCSITIHGAVAAEWTSGPVASTGSLWTSLQGHWELAVLYYFMLFRGYLGKLRGWADLQAGGERGKFALGPG